MTVDLNNKKPYVCITFAYTLLLFIILFSSKTYAAELNISVTSGIGNTALPNQPITIYQRQADDKLKGYRTENTDSSGKLTIDLPGLGNGTVYVLRTQQLHGSGRAYSDDISKAGHFAFKVGNIRVRVTNGRTNELLSGHNISAYKLGADGKYKWFTAAKTDASGQVDFQLNGFDIGEKYIFKGTSLFDDRTWYSEEINSAGEILFTIGNKLLNVVLVNALDQKPLNNTEMTVYQVMPDGTQKWHHRKNTNIEGLISFELPGLGSGSTYVLSTKPYGVRIKTKEISETGPLIIQAGAIAVTLRRKSDSTLMQGHDLHLYESVAPNQLEWRAKLNTGTTGKVNFDVEGLGTGRKFVVRGKNLFANNQYYYSQWITSKGKYEFVVGPDDLHKLDEEPPVFKSFSPQNYSTLSNQGFSLRMQVTDNHKLNRVGLRIYDAIQGITSGEAILSKNEWVFSVTSDMIPSGQDIAVEIEAEDHVGNKTQAIRYYSIIDDTEKPLIFFTSHNEGNQIDEKGFFVTGIVWDNTGVVQLLATVSDPVNGILVNQKEIEIGKTGNWALVAQDLPRGREVSVELKAVDAAGNTAITHLNLKVTMNTPRMVQLLNRMTFGATPELIKLIRFYGAETFINMQLYPDYIDDSAFELQLEALLADESNSYRRLLYSQISRAMYSKRQLLEVMTQFWESHFNTDLKKVKSTAYEQQENTKFREHALGNFGDLLKISATSPAMLIYLDNKDSQKAEPNENYSRELLELHTLGVDKGYTAVDIVEAARIFTGWRVRNSSFYFDQQRHDNEDKTFLGNLIPAGLGVKGGEMALDLLARHQATARFICTKLLRVFVSDMPTQIAVNDCADNFLANADQEDQIALVLGGIFNSSEFSNSINFHNKVKTPFEFVTGFFRQFPVSTNYSKTRTILSEMGMPLFYFPAPTGWPEAADSLVNSNQLVNRWQVARETVFNSPKISRNYIASPSTFIIEQGIETTEGVLGFLFELTLAHDYSQEEWEAALHLLTRQGTERFDIYAEDADEKIRDVISLLLQYPAYQLQ